MDLDVVARSLGKPYFEADGCLLYNLDCLEAMRRIPASAFRLTLTSPPYNIGKEYERSLPLVEYLAWTTSWVNEVHRLTLGDGAFVLNLGYLEIPERAKAIPLPYLIWDSVPFFLIQEIVWNYGAGVAARKTLSPRNEKFLWYVKDPDSYVFNLDEIRDPNVKYPHQFKNGKLKVNPLGKNPTDVWSFPKVTSGRNRSSKERTPHPAQFPEAVVERFVKGMSNHGDVVLDPFLGSGTTAAVALRLGRKAIGFEIDQGYCDLAADRISHAIQRDKQQQIDAAAEGQAPTGTGRPAFYQARL